MNQSSKYLSKKAGLPPGSLIHIGKQKVDEVKISLIEYDQKHFYEAILKGHEECFPSKESNLVSWINLDGLHDTNTIALIGKHFGLHSLTIEDILNTKHRPNLEEFDNYLFLTLKMLGIKEDGKTIISEQISFVLGNGWLISFQEQEGDVFDGLRSRLSEGKGQTRQKGVDYLFYRLIDTIVDHYFYVIEQLGEQSDKLEDQVIDNPDTASMQQIQQMKKQLSVLKKSINPLREAVSQLQHDETALIKSGTVRYLRDVYEHVVQVGDAIETQRDTVSNIMDLHISGVSNKMNQIMKVLTIISTIFIPLTFIAGIYGMNFDNMPELHWKFGYYTVWGIMFVVLGIMILFFKRKRWI